MPQQLSTNTFTTAKWIVSPTASDGTHTTIAGALASASAGDTIFIRPGTYTENPTLVAGVNLTAWGSDSSLNGTGKVIINGNCTLSTAGSVTISGIQLQTNSAAFLTVSGSVASIVNLNGCYLNCSNATGISYTSSSASSQININNCWGNLGTTGIGLWSCSSAGVVNVFLTHITNTGSSLTLSSTSSTQIGIVNSFLTIGLSTSSTGQYSIDHSTIDTSAINTIGLTTAGTGTTTIFNSIFSTGTASAISIGAGTTVNLDSTTIGSTNTNAITGAGTINYTNLGFVTGQSAKVNTTTQTGGVAQGGLTQAPSAGFIGERITSTATGAALSNNTPANVTSISLTAGIWDISCVCSIAFTGTNTNAFAGISATSATFTGTQGDQYLGESTGVSGGTAALSVPAVRTVLTATTTQFLVAQAAFSTGTATPTGRISAVRVG